MVGSGADNYVYDIVVQSDGRIIVGGGFKSIAGQPATNLVRLTSDGRLDGSFSSGTDGSISRLLEQPDGKILVAGTFASLQGVIRQRIGRILPSGIADPSFDSGTFLETNTMPSALGIQLDGKILVGTISAEGTNSRLFRLHTNGLPDGSFIQTNVFYNWHVYALHPLANGSILVAGGFASVNGFPSPGLALLDSSGRLNTNFNFRLENVPTIFSIVEQANGYFLIGGYLRQQGGSKSIPLARLTPSLEWDTNFNTDQFEFVYPVGPYIRSIVLQPDGHILVGGYFEEVGGYWRRHVARLDSQGHVDPCFDPGLGLSSEYGAYTLARQTNGHILVGGVFDSVDGNKRTNIARLLPQSDCNATRVHLVRTDKDSYYVTGTCAPGGTNYLQISSNLVDWVDMDMQTRPYVTGYMEFSFSAAPAAFFRVIKTY